MSQYSSKRVVVESYDDSGGDHLDRIEGSNSLGSAG